MRDETLEPVLKTSHNKGMPSHNKKFPLPGKTSANIYDAVSKNIDLFLSKTPIGNCEVKKDDAGKKVSFKASMASGTLTAEEGQLNVELSLSLMATPFKGKIDEGIEKWLSRAFGPEAPKA